MDSRIALIVCYFGKLPDYFCITERTMGANPSIDWLIFGDQLPVSNYPNVHFIPLSLEEYLLKVQETTGVYLRNPSPYLLCHLRPIYGNMFREYLNSFQFWGYTDLDLLYGDIRKFLPQEILRDHDQLLARGHLVVYRNTPSVNEAYKLISPNAVRFSDLMADFTNPKFHQFDEWRGMQRILRHHGFRQYHRECMADIQAPSRFRIGSFRTSNLPNHQSQIFYWHSGRVFRAYLHPEGGILDEEVAYIHFQKRRFPETPSGILNAPGIGIGPQGFFAYDREPLNAEDFARFNPDLRKSWKDIYFQEVRRAQRKIQSLIS
jgi:hypothetical protein